MSQRIRLGVNIDHVATLRNARSQGHPSVMSAALVCKDSGADKITVHLREDRRHIKDADLADLKKADILPINLEIAATDEMFNIALDTKPYSVCIVPEKREEITTESGLNLHYSFPMIEKYRQKLKDADIKLSLFLDPDPKMLELAIALEADSIEFHTGNYALLFNDGKHTEELERIARCCKLAENAGIECHAGHGLTYENLLPLKNISQIREVNIGHFIIGEAIFFGLSQVIKNFKELL